MDGYFSRADSAGRPVVTELRQGYQGVEGARSEITGFWNGSRMLRRPASLRSGLAQNGSITRAAAAGAVCAMLPGGFV